MNLDSFSKDIFREYKDIKKRRKVYIYKFLALVFWFLAFVLFLKPIFMGVENLLIKYSLSSFLTLMIIMLINVIKKILPKNISLLISGEYINELDNEIDLKKVIKFNILFLVCSILLNYFVSVIYHSIISIINRYGRTQSELFCKQ